MADFLIAWKPVGVAEGLLSIDPHDPGGVTWMGVAITRNRLWVGWQIIDAVLGRPVLDAVKELGIPGVNKLLLKSPELSQATLELAKQKYWDRWQGDSFEVQAIADEALDAQYNAGRGILFLQEALNRMNWLPSGRLWPELKADNAYGPATESAMKTCIRHPRRGARRLFNLQNMRQGIHYWNLQDRNEAMEKFMGWWERVEFVKHGEDVGDSRFQVMS